MAKRSDPLSRAVKRDFPQESTGDAAMDSTLAGESRRRSRAKMMYGPVAESTIAKPKKKGLIQRIKEKMGIQY